MKESEVDIKVMELPSTVLAYVKEHYKGATIKEGAKITKADGTVNYEAEVNKMDVLFDVNGKFIVNSVHVDPLFRDVAPPAKQAISVRAL